ncbi:hypothetical protein AMTRI_Chr11g153990 [Amborella trichopoda]
MQPVMPLRVTKQSDGDGDCAIASMVMSCSIATISSTVTRSCLDLILSLLFSTTLD